MLVEVASILVGWVGIAHKDVEVWPLLATVMTYAGLWYGGLVSKWEFTERALPVAVSSGLILVYVAVSWLRADAVRRRRFVPVQIGTVCAVAAAQCVAVDGGVLSVLLLTQPLESVLSAYYPRRAEAVERAGKGPYRRAWLALACVVYLVCQSIWDGLVRDGALNGDVTAVAAAAHVAVGLWAVFQAWTAASWAVEDYFGVTERAHMDPGLRQSKRVAVIGSGLAGLTAAKHMMSEGHDVTVLTRELHVGGVFRSTYAGAKLTTSTLMTPFSDFHPDLPEPQFLSAVDFGQYIEDYARHYGVLSRVSFGVTVSSVVHRGEGRGAEVIATSPDGQAFSAVFDHVVVSTGTNATVSRPMLEGERSFRGEVIHSSEFHDAATQCAGKRVLLIGSGESGSDISLLVAREAAQVGVSQRDYGRGAHGWNIPRFIFGWPFDLDSTWVHHALPNWLIWYHDIYLMYFIKLLGYVLFRREWVVWANWILEKRRSTMETYGVKNLSMAEAVAYKGAELFPAVRRLHVNEVEFEDGSRFECDMIILCTGFKNCFNFVHGFDPAVKLEKVDRNFVHAIVPGHGLNVVFCGFARSHFAPVPPLAELQARYLAGLFAGRYSLPSADEMQRTIDAHVAYKQQQFGVETADRLASLVEYLLLAERLAGLVGCRPPFEYFLLTDPWLYFHLLLAPMVSSRYRLYGPLSNKLQARRDVLRYPISLQAYAHGAIILALLPFHYLGIPVGMKKPLF